MDDKKKEGEVVSSEAVVNDSVSDTKVETNEVSVSDTVSTVDESVNSEVNSTVSTPVKKSYNIITYVVVGLVVVIMALGLIFLLEKQGRIHTGLFTDIIADMKAKAPAAKVNGVIIPNKDFDSGLQQLMEMAKMQGIDVSGEDAIAEMRKQAIDTLVNGELLRQAAVGEGMEATTEAIDARFNEISEGVGGKEELDKKMAEFGITEESLRRDIANEIMIQNLFEKKMSLDSFEVSEEEVADMYKQITSSGPKAPKLEELRDQIVSEIRNGKQREKISAYIEELKGKANIEILI